MEIKYLKEKLFAMKKLTSQIQDIQMFEWETKMLILEVEKESLIKVNVEIKSSLGIKEDVIMIKWRDGLIEKIHEENVNEVSASKSALKDALDVKKFCESEKEANCCY